MACPPDADPVTRLHARLGFADQHVRWGGGDWVTAAGPLPAELLHAHLAGEAVAAAFPAADGVARAGVIDVDLHAKAGERSTPEVIAVNEAYARKKSTELGARGVAHLLLRHHDGGSYHLRFFTAPVGSVRLGRWLEAFTADKGAVAVDTFPAATGGGNAVRLPGRHHRRPESWTDVWTGTEWAPWPAAFDRLVTLPDNPARIFPDPGPPKADAGGNGPRGDRPGDVFNLLVPVEDVLTAHGWVVERADGDRVRFTRPGKDGGVSASVKDGAVWVFTSSVAGLPASATTGRPYTAFALVAYLEFGGDFAAATKDLARRGFCPPPPAGAARPPAGRYVPVPPYVPFPTDVLPGPWAAFVRQGATALRCDEALVALPLLAVLAAAIGNTRRVHLGGEWFEPAVLWICVVAESGGRKSPAAELAVNLVKARQKRQIKEFRDQVAEYKREIAELKRQAREGDGEPTEPPPKPVLRRSVVADITIEKLADVLDDNRRGLLIYRDELAAWLNSFTRYKGKGGGSDEANWLPIYRADALIYDRKTGDKTTIFVPNAACSIAGGIQPGTLARLMTRNFFDSGLCARILFALPPRVPKTYTEDEIDPDVKAAAEASLAALYDLSAEADDDGDPRPVVVTLSREAKARWRRFVDAWGLKQFEAEGERAAALAKLEAIPGRFALLHHVVTHAAGFGDTDPIGPASIEAGIRLAEWAANECDRVYRVLGETADERDVRRLVEKVQRHGGRLTAFDLRRSNQGRYPTTADAEADLDRLVSLGLGHWEPVGGGPQGGRPTQVFVLGVLNEESAETPGPDDGGSSGDGGPGSAKTPHGGPPPAGPPPGAAAAGPAPDTTCGEPGGGAGEVSAVSSFSTPVREAYNRPPTDDPLQESPWAARPPVSALPVDTDFTPVADTDGLTSVLAAVVADGGPVGLDTETTALDPRVARVRLLQVAVGSRVYVVDLFAFADPAAALAPVFAALASVEVVGHNLQFDLRVLAPLGFAPGKVYDTLLASRVLYAGRRGDKNAPFKHGLADCVRRELGGALAKDEQTSDWSAPVLTPAQLAYAAADVRVLVPLADALGAKLDAAGLTPTAALEMRAVPGVAWAVPVAVDAAAWNALSDEAGTERIRLAAELDALAPSPTGLPGMASRNWDAPDDVKAALAAIGLEVESTADGVLAGLDHPLAALLRDYRSVGKLADTYGRGWLAKAKPLDGRVLTAWNQLGADSGRMSSSNPNLQNLPRDVRYRKCFVAGPGRVLVKADYSQIELRVAAKVAGEERMIAAFRAGEDLHALTAAAILNKPVAEVTKADRPLAKVVNFGLLYGMGWRGLRDYARKEYGVKLTDDQAKEYRDAFFKAYPGLRRWHDRVGSGVKGLFNQDPNARHDAYTVGRRRLSLAVGGGSKDNRFPNVSEALNHPVQGTAADGFKAAVALLWDRRAECPSAVPVLFVHDEVVVECDGADAGKVAAWLRAAMLDGMGPFADPVPVEVEVAVGRTWGGD